MKPRYTTAWLSLSLWFGLIPCSLAQTEPEPIIFTPSGGSFLISTNVTLTTSIADGVIRFTLDGAAPSVDSPAYESAIPLRDSTTIQVRVFTNDLPASELASASFVRSDSFHDGIPDAWRIEHFGPEFATDPDAGATADPDQDGANNYLEHATGTNPQDPESFARVPVSVSTFAGGIDRGAQDGFRTEARFNYIAAFAFDAQGRLWIPEAEGVDYAVAGPSPQRLRLLDTNGVVSTLAGAESAYVDGPLAQARFGLPTTVVFDSQGNAFVADLVNHVIRKIDTNGIVNTFAGSTRGYRDGVGTNAQFDVPYGLVIDRQDNLFVGDWFNLRIRMITPEAEVTTFSGSTRGSADGPRLEATYDGAVNLAFDPVGNLLVSDWANGRIRRIDTNGMVTTLVAGLSYPEAISTDSRGNIFCYSGGSRQLNKYSPDGQLLWRWSTPPGTADGPIETAEFNGRIGRVLELPNGDLLASDDARLRILHQGPQPLLTMAPASGSFRGQLSVSLNTPPGNAAIHYTLDGSAPTPESPVCHQGILLLQSARVRARLFVDTVPVSGELAGVYTEEADLPPQPLAHWTFDETDGSTAHDAVGGFDGQLSATGASFVADGVAGNALALDQAAGGFVSAGNVLGLEWGPFSIVAWVRMNAGDTADSSVILGKHDAGWANGYFLFANRSSAWGQTDKASFYDSAWSFGQEATSTTSVNDGQWHQIAVTHAPGSAKRIYVDGVPAEAEEVATQISPNGAPFLFGGFWQNGGPVPSFTGWIDDVQFFGAELTDDAVAYLHANPGQRLPAEGLPPTVRVTVVPASAGSVTRTPDLEVYPPGTAVTLFAAAAEGMVFDHWERDLGGTNNPVTILVDWPRDISAVFRDVAPPVIGLSSPQPGTTADERLVVAGQITDRGGIASAAWDLNGISQGSLPLDTNGSFSVAGPPLRLGANTLRVRAIDMTGNEASLDIAVSWVPARVLSVQLDSATVREGQSFRAAIQLANPGDVGGVSLRLRYDAEVLELLNWDWDAVTDSALRGLNTSLPGEVLATLAFPGTTLPSGNPVLLALQFRVRSVWTSLDTALLPELLDVATSSGAAIDHGSIAQDQTLHVSRRLLLGDNNANDRLDVGDVSLVQAMILGLQPRRAWDVSGNDLNWNTLLDSGDAVKILRAAAGLDPQPEPVAEGTSVRPGSLDRSSAGLAGPSLTLDRPQGAPGEVVTLHFRLSGGTVPVSAAAFTLEYPTEALRLRNAGSMRPGAIVPAGAAVLWNVAPSQNDFAAQNGAVSCALSSALAWPSPSGELATLTFEIQAGQTARHRWPIRLAHAEVSPNGYALVPLPPVTVEFIGRPASAPAIDPANCRMTDLGFELTFTGEPDVDYTIEWSTDLEHWEPLTTLRSATGTLSLGDIGANASPGQRFYRIRQPQD